MILPLDLVAGTGDALLHLLGGRLGVVWSSLVRDL